MTELYTDLSDLPLYNWIEIAVSGNTKWLVKSGEVPEDIDEHYATLLAEYQTLVQDAKSTNEHQIKVNYAKLANRIDHITIAVNALRIERDEGLISILQNMLGFERLTYENLQKDLDMTETYLKMDIIKFNQAKNQLEKIIKTAGDTEGINSKGAFYQQITSLSKWLQFGINPKETSVLQYVSYLNALSDEIRRSDKSRTT